MRARRTQTTWLSVCLNGGSRGGGAVREHLPQSGVKSGCQARGPRLLYHYSRFNPDQPPPSPAPSAGPGRRCRTARAQKSLSQLPLSL